MTKAPYQVETFNEVCKLPRDGDDYADAWIIIDLPHVVITNQRLGEKPSGQVKLSRRQMTRFAKWWLGLNAKAALAGRRKNG